MVNDLLKVVLLAEVHGGLLSEAVAVEVFGEKTIDSFRKKYPQIQFEKGYIGAGSRSVAVRRMKESRRKLKYAEKLFRSISWVRWIRFAGVTGSVSYGNSRKDDDIDVFLVVQHNRLWLVRLVEQFVFRILGVRLSFGDTDRKDRICINYYVSEQSIQVEPKEQNILTALEIAMMKPILHKKYLSFILEKNQWMENFFPNMLKNSKKFSVNTMREDLQIYRWYYIFGDVLDWLARFAQITYMKIMRHRRGKGEVLGRNEVRFFSDKVWEDREKELEKKLQLYNL